MRDFFWWTLVAVIGYAILMRVGPFSQLMTNVSGAFLDAVKTVQGR